MTGADALRSAIARLKDGGLIDPARDARLLLAHAMQIGADRLTLHLPETLSEAAIDRFDQAIAARLKRQPVSQITGRRAFWGRSFVVTPDVLDPRPETECLIAKALDAPFERVLDLGTGSGAILLSLLAERPGATGLGGDISDAALEVATRNCQRLDLNDRAEFVVSNWFENVDDRFDLVVSNPPYIGADEMDGLAPETRDWEPHLALTPGGDGLTPYRIIAAQAGKFMTQNARILLEIGPTQGHAVSGFLSNAGFENVTVLPDFDGRDRVVSAIWHG